MAEGAERGGRVRGEEGSKRGKGGCERKAGGKRGKGERGSRR